MPDLDGVVGTTKSAGRRCRCSGSRSRRGTAKAVDDGIGPLEQSLYSRKVRSNAMDAPGSGPVLAADVAMAALA